MLHENSTALYVMASGSDGHCIEHVVVLYEFILSDVKGRADVALTWVYTEYVRCHGFTVSEGAQSTGYTDYEQCLTSLLVGLLECKEVPGAAA